MNQMTEKSWAMVNKDTIVILKIDGVEVARAKMDFELDDEVYHTDFELSDGHASTLKTVWFEWGHEALGAKMGNGSYIYFDSFINTVFLRDGQNVIYITSSLSVRGFSAELRQ